jgi:uncharacterized protein (TIGR02001 family)
MQMKKYILYLSFVAISSSAFAIVEGDFSAYSNFIWRGTTFSENKPAIQGIIDGEENHGFFLGAFISNAEFSDEAMGEDAQVTQEVDYSVGKRWESELWEVQLSYNSFTFPGAGVFDTDEFNLLVKYRHLILELSYMDDYFGYQSTYNYVRAGHEWSYSKSLDATFFIGYNAFGTPKGGIKTRCLDSGCNEVAQTTHGAGNTDYIDILLTHRKTMINDIGVELAINWTNRYEYTVENSQISKDPAKDFAVFIGVVVPFTL